MSSTSIDQGIGGQPAGLFTRRSLLGVSAAAGALGLGLLTVPEYAPAAPATSEGVDAVRPFHVSFPQEALVDLRRRIAATRFSSTAG
jgi:hypothetical protein